MDMLNPQEAKKISQECFLFGIPLVYIDLSRDVATNVPEPQGNLAPINQFGHFRTFPDASNREVVGFNLDTLYSFGWFDLSAEPLVLSIPDMGDRYWNMMVMDAWNDVPAAPGSRTIDDGKGGNFAIVGPHWKGYIPEGLTEIHNSTNIGAVAGRIYSSGEGDDLAMVQALQDQVTLTPLSKWDTGYRPPANVPVKPGVDTTSTIPEQVMAMSVEEFFNRLAMLLADNPPHEADDPIIAKLAKLGIEPGVEFKLSKNPLVRAATKVGYIAGWKELESWKDKLGDNINGWMLTLGMGRYGTKYGYRAVWTFVGIGGNLAEDAVYPIAREDGAGQPLSGTNDYTVTFSKEQIPPVDAFWSLTIYDGESFLVDNPIDRYSLSGRDEMNYGEDGSLTIYIQHESPGEDKEANWLPAPEGDIGYLALRLYSPKKQVLDGTWKPEPVMRVGAPEQRQVASADTPDSLSSLVAAIYEAINASSGISLIGRIGEQEIDILFSFISSDDGPEQESE